MISEQNSSYEALLYEEALPETDQYYEQSSWKRRRSIEATGLTRNDYMFIILKAVFVMFTSFMAYSLGKLQACSSEFGGLQELPSPTIQQVSLADVILTLSANDSFTQVPLTDHSEPAWDSLLPNGLGYVQHESFGFNTSIISVFHQLHCLYTLRRIFYSTINHPFQGSEQNLEDFDFGIDRMKHSTHCFEYLRLSLMCNADSRLEPVDLNADEFPGLGVPRQCKDYEQLKRWAEDRRVFDATGFLAAHQQHGKQEEHQ